MTRLICILGLVVVSIHGSAHAAEQTSPRAASSNAKVYRAVSGKLRRAAAVAVVGGALVTSGAHAADLNAAIDAAMRPAALSGMVLPKDLGESAKAPTHMNLADSRTTKPANYSYDDAPSPIAAKFAIKWSPAPAFPTSVSDAVLGGVHAAVQKWVDKDGDSRIAKAALAATDPSHVTVNVKLKPVSVAISYHSSFR